MFLGIEIGGTKLQFGVGTGDGTALVTLERADVALSQGAQAILHQVERIGRSLIEKYDVAAIGIGFGGPVDIERRRIVTSHQVEGWDDFPLADWCRAKLNRPTMVRNDSDAAGLAEARFGAGCNSRVVFYSNVGSGIGGSLCIDGELYHGGSGIAAELGHLRPGLMCNQSDQTVEATSSGWAIALAIQAKLDEPISHSIESLMQGSRPSRPDELRQRLIELEDAEERDVADLLSRCDGQIAALDARLIALAAAEGNELAIEVFDHASRAYGWALAQMIALVNPNIIVLGGGVSQADEHIFLQPVRHYVDQYVFPSLANSFQIVPSRFGEQVVLHGALAMASFEK